MIHMETEKKLTLMQNTYAAAVAETVNSYEKLKVLDKIVETKKERQVQTAPYMNAQLEIASPEEVFTKLTDTFGCANWMIEKTEDRFIAIATSCKLCALSKRMGGANPCQGWCLDPMFAMITAATDGGVSEKNIAVESTLMTGEHCKVIITMSE